MQKQEMSIWAHYFLANHFIGNPPHLFYLKLSFKRKRIFFFINVTFKGFLKCFYLHSITLTLVTLSLSPHFILPPYILLPNLCE